MYKDERWVEGYYKDGVLHGFARYFDDKVKLKLITLIIKLNRYRRANYDPAQWIYFQFSSGSFDLHRQPPQRPSRGRLLEGDQGRGLRRGEGGRCGGTHWDQDRVSISRFQVRDVFQVPAVYYLVYRNVHDFILITNYVYSGYLFTDALYRNVLNLFLEPP